MLDGPRLKDLYLNDFTTNPATKKPLLECDSIDTKGWRIFYIPNSEGCGFQATALTFGARPAGGPDWGPDTIVGDEINISALFDGVRHLYTNVHGDPDMKGYIYYPSRITNLFNALNELCEEYCQPGAWDRL